MFVMILTIMIMFENYILIRGMLVHSRIFFSITTLALSFGKKNY